MGFDESWSWWRFLRVERTVSVADHLDVSGVASLMECFLQNPGSSSAHIDVGQICPTLEKETLRYTPQLVKTVAKEIMRLESSRQIRSQTCCSATIDSKNHLVAPAVSTDDYPVIQEDDSVKKNSKL